VFSRKLWIAFGLIFSGMVMVFLVVTGVFREGIWPRVKPAAERALAKWRSQPEAGARRPATAERRQRTGTGNRLQASGSGSAVAEAGALTSSKADSQQGARGVGRGEEQQDDRARLVRLYTGMRPREAASIVEKLEPSLAAQILVRLPDRQAARILGSMDPEIAARLTRGMTRGGS
jgi:flagellar motility protein MotE (MotC chaperone)